MKLSLSSLAATAVVIAAPSSALAQGWYADGGYTHITTDVDGTSGDIDLGTITGHLGYDLNQTFGVEGEVAFGVNDEDTTVGDVTTSLGLNYLVGVYGKAQMPLGERAKLFARAGIVNAELEAETTGLGSTEQSETGAGYGVGGTVDISQNLFVRGDYTRYDIDDLEADAFTVGVGLKF